MALDPAQDHEFPGLKVGRIVRSGWANDVPKVRCSPGQTVNHLQAVAAERVHFI